MPRGTVLQWMTARALCEGAPATPERVAALMDVEVDAVLARSVSENWRWVDRGISRAGTPTDGIAAAGTAGEGHPEHAGPAPAGPCQTTGDGGADGGDGADTLRRTGRHDQPLDGPAAARLAGRDATADPDDWPPAGMDPAAVLAGASAFVTSRMAALIERAERDDAGLDKKEIDGLSAFAAMLERWEARALERVQEEESTSDDDLARYVRDVNERIVALAALEARRLLAAGFRPQVDA